MRRADKVQLWCVGLGLIFLVTVAVLAQSQDYINGSVVTRLNDFDARLGKLETYVTAAIAATISNLIAHIISIRSSSNHRRRRIDIQ